MSSHRLRIYLVGGLAITLPTFGIWLVLTLTGLARADINFAIASTVAVSLVVGPATWIVQKRRRQLAGTESRFRALLESLPDAVVITEKNGAIVLINSRAEQLFGFSREELRGKSLEHLVRQQIDVGDSVDGIEGTNLISSGEPEEAVPTFMGRRKDGSELEVELSFNPLALPDGLLIINSIRDITERKLHERRRAARYAVRRLAAKCDPVTTTAPTLLQAIGDALGWDFGAFWVVDRDTNALQCIATRGNSALKGEELDALSRQTPIARGDGIPGRVLASNQPLWTRNLASQPRCPRMKAATRAGLQASFAFPILLDNQVLGVIEAFTRTAYEPDANLLETMNSIGGQVGQFLHRRRSEEALHESEARKTAILEAALDAIITVDHEGRIVEFNPAAQGMFGRLRSAVIGQDLAKLLLPVGMRAAFRAELAASGTTGETVILGKRRELTALRANGDEFAVELALARIRNDGPPLYTAYIRDLSDRKRVEDALKVSEERVRQMQKMEAIGRLAGGVAHDFNNLLVVIISFSELLLRQVKAGDPKHEMLVEIHRAGERAAGLTQQLLAFSRKQVLQPRVLDLNELVTGMEKMLHRLIGEDIDLVTVLDPKLHSVTADPGQIEQVLLNLAVNSRDAMPDGGKLTIETADVEIDASAAKLQGGVRPGRYVMVAVTDTGFGMDDETKAKVFEPFFTTKEMGKGTGLGLATVYGIVQQSGGHVTVYSEPEHGTTFKIYLPLVEIESLDILEPVEAPELPRGQETVLIVEDEPAVRGLVRQVLRENGYTVLEASQGEEAIAICQSHPGPIHMMLTDVVMPHMSGRQLADRVATMRPEMRTLFASGYPDGAITRHGVLTEGTAFLQKPFTPERLERMVREVLSA